MSQGVAGEPRIDLNTRVEVEAWLMKERQVLLARSNSLQAPPAGNGTHRELVLAVQARPSAVNYGGGDNDGIGGGRSYVYVPNAVFDEMQAMLHDACSTVRRLSSWPIVRAFVYLDISDFSKLPTGVQLLVIQALVKLAPRAERDIGGTAEARLCIGDGYIYVWDEAVAATRFAGYLAREIENAVSEGRAPEFHFRIGVHVGPVRCFWDPGRNDWNYVGDGINGGNRVLSAIGKDTDDVVFVSGEVRTELLGNHGRPIVPHLHNRGRKADKHGRHWRVYELNHSAPV